MKKVCCFGTFDMLHQGHREFFKDIKKRGNYLVVIVIPDLAVYENKGRWSRNDQKERIRNLKKLKIIDAVLSTSSLNETMGLIYKINPSIFAFGYDQNTPAIKKFKKMVKESGLDIKYYVSKEFAGGIHTSKLN